MIQGVVFDFDGTLYNYDKCNSKALDILFEKIALDNNLDIVNIKQTYMQINHAIKQSNNCSNKFNKIIYIKQLCEKLNVQLYKIEEYVNLYNQIFSSTIKLYDGVKDLFSILKTYRVKIGVLTNNKFDQQFVKLSQFGLIEYIDVIQSSDECGNEKPDINIFLRIQHKLQIPWENLCVCGDNFDHDIVPTINLNAIPFYFSLTNTNKLENRIFYFSDYYWLINFLKSYFISINELIFLSKYFGQSELNVQGPGGNISIKTDEIMLIKSSGCIMGNITPNSDYCIVNTKKCKELINQKRDNILETKIFGYKVPSMETYFHSCMKKYTVHIHFTLLNIFACSENFANTLSEFKYAYCIIEYQVPGILLSYDIKQKYNSNCDIYYLLNHGLIITSDSIDKILEYYKYIFEYFNQKLNRKYSFDSFDLNAKYAESNNYKIVKETIYTKELFENMIICFPDLAVFVQNICVCDKLEDLSKSDIVIYKNKVYIVTENIYKAYSLIEIINSYIELEENSKILVKITNINFLQNMEQEKYRK